MTFLVIFLALVLLIIIANKSGKKQIEKAAVVAEKLKEEEAEKEKSKLERIENYHVKVGYKEGMLAEEHIRCDVAGTHVDRRESLCGKCKSGEELIMEREPLNKYDKNAIRIDNSMGGVLGYIPAIDAKRLAPRIDKGDEIFLIYFDSDHYSGSRYYAHVSIVRYK